MRLFAAIDIPDEIKERLRVFVDRLRPLAKISWSPVENLHITTKFIGDWPEGRLPEMKDALAQMSQQTEMDIHIHKVGWFPDEKNPRVFWAGVEAGNSLAVLAQATEQVTATLGVAVEERTFSPHLTLARIREAVPLDALRSALAKESKDFGSFRATRFFLYLSAGGKYTQLTEYALRGKP